MPKFEEHSEAPHHQEVQKSSDFTASIPLPSGFRPYSFKELKIRPLNVEEVKNLQPVLNGGTSGLKLADVLQSAMSVRPDKLTYGDFWYVLAWLRLNSFENAPYRIKWRCNHCKTVNNLNLSLTDLEIVELDENYKEPANVALPSGTSVPCRLLRVEDESKVENYASAVLRLENPNSSDLALIELAAGIDNGKGLHSNYELLSSGDYTAEDITILSQFQKAFAHGLPKYISDTCGGEGGCGHVVSNIRLNFRISDTIPSNEYRQYIRDHISFG